MIPGYASACIGEEMSVLAGDQVEETAEPPVRISPAGLEFGRHDSLDVRWWRFIDVPRIGEEPYAIPGHHTQAVCLEPPTQIVHTVGPGVETEPVDLALGVERLEDSCPIPVPSWQHRQRVDVLGHY